MDSMYREILIDKYKNPVHKKKLLAFDLHKVDSNPLCGDSIEVFLKVDSNNIIVDASFEGKGCVISMASADLLLDFIIGKSIDEVYDLSRDDMLDLLSLELTHSRIKCAMLALQAIKKSIIEFKGKSD